MNKQAGAKETLDKLRQLSTENAELKRLIAQAELRGTPACPARRAPAPARARRRGRGGQVRVPGREGRRSGGGEDEGLPTS